MRQHSVASDPGVAHPGKLWDGGFAELGNPHSCFLLFQNQGPFFWTGKTGPCLCQVSVTQWWLFPGPQLWLDPASTVHQ